MKRESLYGILKIDGGKKHIYLLPGQELEDGTKVDPSLRVQCDRTTKDSADENTLWKFKTECIKVHTKGTHYTLSGGEMKNISTLTKDTQLVKITSDLGYLYVFSTTYLTGSFIVTQNCEEIIRYYTGRPVIVDKESRSSKLIVESILDECKDDSSITNFLGFSTLEEFDSKEKSVDGEEIKEVHIPTWKEITFKDPRLKCPNPKTDGFYMSDDKWKLLIRNIKRKVNTLILGPAGTGKTSCIKQAADKLGLPLYIFDMGAMIDPISSLLGVHRLKDGRSIFDYAQFTKAIQEPCIILLDELNRAPIGAGNILFPCLDDRRTLPIEIASGEGVRDIKIHPEVAFLATANIGSEYTGTSVLDRALVNRFFPLELSHLKDKVEKEVLQVRTGITTEQSEMIVKVANTLRNMNDKMEISMAVSVRETLMISNLVKDGWNLGEAMKAVYLPLYEGSDSEGERSKIFKVLASY